MNEEKLYLVGVSINSTGKSYFFLTTLDDLKLNEAVVCNTQHGLELGYVTVLPKEKEETILEDAFPHVLKRADESDLIAYNNNLLLSEKAKEITQKTSDELGLNMNIISGFYTLDGTKVTLSYLADDRVDFRDLLKILANKLRCRIELRQIGTRDRAKMIGGIGICGLKLCCSSFLNEFDGISITMAKNQMLALNIPKLSGHCGKLICCLKYEDAVYSEEKKSLPRIGVRVNYDNAVYKLTSINIITKMARLENSENILTVPVDEIKDKIINNNNKEDNK